MEQQILNILLRHTTLLEENAKKMDRLESIVIQNTRDIVELKEMTMQNTGDIAGLKEVTIQHTKDIAEQKVLIDRNSVAIEEIMKVLKQHTEILAEHTEQLADLRRSSLIIEEYVTKRIPLLFDAFSMHDDKHISFEKSINHLDRTTSVHSTKISVLEDTVNEHTEQLTKILS